MKKFMATLCTVLMLLCVSFTFTGCDFFGDNDKKLFVSDENISIAHNEYIGYTVTVTGTIENTTGKDLSYISVEYKVYDSSNAIIGTALANANNIGKGETWRFRAISLGTLNQYPLKVTFSEIQTLQDF